MTLSATLLGCATITSPDTSYYPVENEEWSWVCDQTVPYTLAQVTARAWDQPVSAVIHFSLTDHTAGGFWSKEMYYVGNDIYEVEFIFDDFNCLHDLRANVWIEEIELEDNPQ